VEAVIHAAFIYLVLFHAGEEMTMGNLDWDIKLSRKVQVLFWG
jgi:hypothetical protein